MAMTTLYGIVTLCLIIAFIGLCIWAYSPKRHQQFMKDANIPFLEEHSNHD